MDIKIILTALIVLCSILLIYALIRRLMASTMRYSCIKDNCVEDPNGTFTHNNCCIPPTKRPAPSSTLPVIPDKTYEEYLTAVPGTAMIDAYPLLSNDLNIIDSWPLKQTQNNTIDHWLYSDLIKADFKRRLLKPCSDLERSKLLSYLKSVFYLIDSNNLQKLSTEELTAFYRSLVFYYITTQDTQPDGGWYGSYWSKRIIDDGPVHDKITGKTNMTGIRNESFLFDQQMSKTVATVCNGYNMNSSGKCPNHTKFFGNRIFTDPFQASLRRGMRNSPQVLAENPPWSKTGNPVLKYGIGGFPKDAYVECLQFPQEHGYGGWPSGCNATNEKCNIEPFEPRYQPLGKNRTSGGDPFCGMKPQWFYFSQGNGQFWNMGETSYCYNYVDIFLNGPMGIGINSHNGKNYPIGWSNSWVICTDKINQSSTLGYDIENTSVPTEHDYSDPIYSMLLILEYESRSDIPGSCNDSTSCYPGLRDPRTGMMGLGYCSGSPCPCTGDPDVVTCLNSKCKASQPVTSRGDALNAQVAALMGLKYGTYWEPYSIPGTTNLNSAPGIIGTLNQYGGFDPTPTWLNVRRRKNRVFPVRSSDNYASIPNKDNRYYVVGWVNGNFYGYPKTPMLSTNIPNPYPEGVMGNDPVTGNVIYGKHFTGQIINVNGVDIKDSLIYTDMHGNFLYETWYNKPIQMSEDVALLLMSEFYSCGDTGYENFDYNWPFGCYFGYGQSLGTPGKSAANGLSCFPYNCTTTQFTCVATSYGSIVQPAYDFEILYNPPVKSKDYPVNCTCATSVTLDITADFMSDTAGEDLKRYLCLNKGSIGGYVPKDSKAGKTAVAFDGSQMKVTNWTTFDLSGNGAFDPKIPNSFGVSSNPGVFPGCPA